MVAKPAFEDLQYCRAYGALKSCRIDRIYNLNICAWMPPKSGKFRSLFKPRVSELGGFISICNDSKFVEINEKLGLNSAGR